MESASIIAEIATRVGGAIPPRSEVLLFGSHARGNASSASDFDILVIEENVPDPIAESVRLMRLLRDLLAPIDIVVLSREQARVQEAVRGTLAERARREGRVLDVA